MSNAPPHNVFPTTVTPGGALQDERAHSSSNSTPCPSVAAGAHSRSHSVRHASPPTLRPFPLLALPSCPPHAHPPPSVPFESSWGKTGEPPACSERARPAAARWGVTTMTSCPVRQARPSGRWRALATRRHAGPRYAGHDQRRRARRARPLGQQLPAVPQQARKRRTPTPRMHVHYRPVCGQQRESPADVVPPPSCSAPSSQAGDSTKATGLQWARQSHRGRVGRDSADVRIVRLGRACSPCCRGRRAVLNRHTQPRQQSRAPRTSTGRARPLGLQLPFVPQSGSERPRSLPLLPCRSLSANGAPAAGELPCHPAQASRPAWPRLALTSAHRAPVSPPVRPTSGEPHSE